MKSKKGVYGVYSVYLLVYRAFSDIIRHCSPMVYKSPENQYVPLKAAVFPSDRGGALLIALYKQIL